MTHAAAATLLLRMLALSLPLEGPRTNEAARNLLMHCSEEFRLHLAQALGRVLYNDQANVVDVYYSISLCGVFTYCNPVPFMSTSVEGAEYLLKSLFEFLKPGLYSDIEAGDRRKAWCHHL